MTAGLDGLDGGSRNLRAELIAVGDELLYGDIVNGNAAWLGQQLADVGVELHHSEVVGDIEDDIVDAIRAALARADVAILTGGLGPTQDDLTREGIARAAGVALHRDEALEAQLRQRFSDLRRVVPDMNYRQADLPEGATPLPNSRGTAPGIRLELPGVPPKVVYALPGVPHEMYAMFSDEVLPDLLRRTGRPAAIVHRVLRTAGMWESAVAEALSDVVAQSKANGSNPAIAFLASQGQTRVRITARAADRAAALRLIAPVEEAARAALGVGCYGVDDDSLEGVVHRLLREQNATVATAESLTGGLLAGRLTDVPGSSAAFLGGVVAYATELKHALLGVPAEVLQAHGAVSDETAMAMATGVRERLGATYGLATTGVAGPDLQEGKPAGTLHIGIAGPDGASAHALRMPGDRNLVRTYASVSALDALRRVLLARQA
jgi:nicotinamide-nucleotide amidase